MLEIFRPRCWQHIALNQVQQSLGQGKHFILLQVGHKSRSKSACMWHIVSPQVQNLNFNS